MIKLIKNVCVAVIFATILVSCNKENKFLEADDAKSYIPLTIGKYITYKLDSTNYIGYTTTPTLSSYFAKDEVTEKITDNLGRESYRIVRFIKKNWPLCMFT